MNGPLRKDKDKSNNLLGSSQQKHRNTSRNPFKGHYKKEMFAISLAILIALLVLLVTHVSTGDNDAVPQANQSVNQTVEIPTQIYSAGGISVQYPASWNITTDEINGTNTQIVIQDPASASNPQSTQIAAFTVLKEQKDPNETLDQCTANFIQSIESSGVNMAATNTSSINLNDINANQTIYAGNDPNYNKIQLKVIYFEQNDMFYILAFLTKGMDLESQDQYFNIILNSFKVQ